MRCECGSAAKGGHATGKLSRRRPSGAVCLLSAQVQVCTVVVLSCETLRVFDNTIPASCSGGRVTRLSGGMYESKVSGLIAKVKVPYQ